MPDNAYLATSLLTVLLILALCGAWLISRGQQHVAATLRPPLQCVGRLSLDRGRVVYAIRFGDAAIAVLISSPERTALVLSETRFGDFTPSHAQPATIAVQEPQP